MIYLPKLMIISILFLAKAIQSIKLKYTLDLHDLIVSIFSVIIIYTFI